MENLVKEERDRIARQIMLELGVSAEMVNELATEDSRKYYRGEFDGLLNALKIVLLENPINK